MSRLPPWLVIVFIGALLWILGVPWSGTIIAVGVVVLVIGLIAGALAGAETERRGGSFWRVH